MNINLFERNNVLKLTNAINLFNVIIRNIKKYSVLHLYTLNILLNLFKFVDCYFVLNPFFYSVATSFLILFKNNLGDFKNNDPHYQTYKACYPNNDTRKMNELITNLLKKISFFQNKSQSISSSNRYHSKRLHSKKKSYLHGGAKAQPPLKLIIPRNGRNHYNTSSSSNYSSSSSSSSNTRTSTKKKK